MSKKASQHDRDADHRDHKFFSLILSYGNQDMIELPDKHHDANYAKNDFFALKFFTSTFYFFTFSFSSNFFIKLKNKLLKIIKKTYANA